MPTATAQRPVAFRRHFMCGSPSGYCSDMWTLYLSVFSILLFLTTGESNFLYTNGWIPVSSETVYNQINRENAQIPSYADTHNIQVINTDINKVTSLQNQLIKQEEIEDDTQPNFEEFETASNCVTKDVSNCQIEKTVNKPLAEQEHDVVPNVFHNPLKYNDKVDPSTRRSKKIADFNFKTYVQRLLLNEVDNTETGQKVNTYEVTEESNVEDLIEQEKSETNESGYKYEPPKKHNHTSGLFGILSKYNINKDDELLNYALSRRLKAQVPLNQNLNAKPFQNKILNRYNNLNHLPVDPLLAVFLSNYGYYLQGMYGVHNRYNNLYGYLASNNIHNNRPFGFYKLFSDTDSSH